MGRNLEHPERGLARHRGSAASNFQEFLYRVGVVLVHHEGDLKTLLTSRLRRLRTREAIRYGPSVAPGGPGEDAQRAFLEWAQGYDALDFPGRSRAA
jgi:hypothetical protein